MTESHSQRLRRARPVLAIALVAFAIGAIVGAHRSPSPASALAERFAAAWTRGDYASMYADIDVRSQRATSPSEFAAAYRRALSTATAYRLGLRGRVRSIEGGAIDVPVTVRTRLFGTLALDYALRVAPGGESAPRLEWSRSLAFPGLHPGETLTRRTTLPRRAALLARDGSVLAESGSSETSGAPAEGTRSSPLGESARAVLGTVGPIPSSRLASLEAAGVPAEASVGLTGLERALDDRLRGAPGGVLLAGSRVLGSARSRAAPAVRTTILPALQSAAVLALGGQLGGVVALQPSTGQILAVAGIGLDGLQPPGSTFKIITVTGALQANVATPRTVYPYATHATLDGVKLSNANGEECGGSLELAFTVSCNSVFSPLGVKLGAPRLVAAAEAFGFNHDPGLPGAAESTLPPAASIQGELDVGSTAIGQGQVQATPLEMAIVAATIADGGRRPAPRFLPDATPAAVGRATSASVARTVRHLMIDVVRSGTGTAAAIPGVVVAGKTGTAELKSACPSNTQTGSSETEPSPPEGCAGSESQASNTDAWFASFAPAIHPRIAVCVMLVKDGAGGATAAPVARQVLEAGLRALR
ncbi:MAG TPA: penicillin-binding transpeptidase domain-containing protein [Solirubrobacteraceae bacterium]